jgi:hypothetical protein
MPSLAPGLVALLGSGETSSAGGQVYDLLARSFAAPLKVALLETPAGFQPNAAQVAGKIADFLRVRLQNYRPDIALVPARQRGTPYSPDDPHISQPICAAELLLLGPGSPTYAARQLRDSLAYQRLVARQRRGAALIAASAGTIALSASALPVYEIYKVGQDLHWQPGLDFFGPYGLRLAIMPHWNNSEGGAELDTSRCFMGQARFARLLELLPPATTVLGIDEHTALVIDLAEARCQVLGRGAVTLLRAGTERRFTRHAHFALDTLGKVRQPEPAEGLPEAVWAELAAREAAPPEPEPVPEAVRALLALRQDARSRRDWAASDALRLEIAGLGWEVRDTPEGPAVQRRAVG